MTREQLLTGIENRNNGKIDLADFTLNLAIDLIIFHNFSVDEVLQLSDDDISLVSESLEDNGGYCEFEHDYINTTCHKCGRELKVEYNPCSDTYLEICECGNCISIHPDSLYN